MQEWRGRHGVLFALLLGGQVVIDIELNGVPGYQVSTRDRRITTTIPAGNTRVEWDGRDGLNAVVSSGTSVTLLFKNSKSPIAPVNFPVWDAENNADGFRIQNVRPGSQGFEVLYWDDSNLSTAAFPNMPANPRTQLAGVPSNMGVHTWGGGATGSATVASGNQVLVNTYTYGNTEQESRIFTFNYACDPDGDGINDNLDVDQDNDGITNVVESNGIDPTFITASSVPRYIDPYEANFVDVNQDGVNDVYDFDLDGIPSFLDIDADGDGIPDTMEANGGVAPTGYTASLGRFPSTGVGANGMPDVAETTAESGITKLPITNTDNVGQPDYLDIDSDNDGIVDNIEAQTTTGYRAPLGLDTDRDGLDNRYDPTTGPGQTAGVAVPLTNTDAALTNSDTLPDYRDLNSDGDGRTDAIEGWDTNNDGVAEQVFSGIDVDGDGLDDAYDTDSTSPDPTNGQLPTSFPDNNTATTERAWREVLTPQTITTLTISGRIFEDVNYGGGAGRSYADANTSAVGSGFTSAAIGRAGVTVELYDANGNYVTSTVTGLNGAYSFVLTGRSAGNYSVRVVSSTGFTSVRAGTVTGLLPVQTFAYGVTNKVGGEIPTKIDAGVRTAGQTLSDIINGTTTTAQSLATITVPAGTTSSVTNIDFGFNFDVISNTNSSGQGSLAQFITNANALPNTNLNQTGLSRPGVETSIFMIGDGNATGTPPTGLRIGVDGGTDPDTHVATIKLTASLPNITDPNTNLDGSRQTVVTGSTPTTSSEESTDPEVIIDFNGFKGLFVTGGNTRIASLGLVNAKGTSAATSGAVFSDGAAVTFSTATVAGSIVTDVTTLNNAIAGVRIQSGTSTTVTTGVTVSNSVFNNAATNFGTSTIDGDGINLIGASGNTITGNVIADNKGFGIYLATTASNNNNISGNTIRNNGTGTSVDDAGIAVAFGNNNLIAGNTITGNAGDGIVALNGTSGNRFTQNITSGNTGIGIDLSNGTVMTGDDVTTNVNSGSAAGANGRLNFPAFTQATISGGVLQITGFAPAGALIEIFLADNDGSKFGEGKTFLTSVTEGSAADRDAKIGSYSGTNNHMGIDQGSETNANRFYFKIALSAQQLALLQIGGAQITSTATILSSTLVNGTAVGNTSEFSGNIFLSTAPLPVELTKFDVIAQTNNALLTWATASEKNNDHFDVERSVNGTTFERVGTVKGNGSTTTAHQYSFVDAGASRFGQQLYYRLRQVDTDGTEAFSPVRTVTFAPQTVQVTLYPNPATTTTTLDLSTLPLGTYSVTLIDMTGRTLITEQVAGGIRQPLMVSQLPAGTYLVRIQGTNTNLTQRLVKQK
ncbi:beta strand repeat-containing protein [Hymenobacter radiodurans]|uniref:beta strand repeat-containing protein n=1 Tax=Hymenobacter radiodurans TaxID=2496028 RepID=UPI0010591E13|nr:right-handed parallel beta-helix repeat-containing protein [Hymenobacter radiodurans]